MANEERNNQELENQNTQENQENNKPETPAEEKKDGFFKKAGRALKKAATSKIACTAYGILGGTVLMGVIGKVFGKDDTIDISRNGNVLTITEKVPEIAEQVSEAVTEATEK